MRLCCIPRKMLDGAPTWHERRANISTKPLTMRNSNLTVFQILWIHGENQVDCGGRVTAIQIKFSHSSEIQIWQVWAHLKATDGVIRGM